ncbi:type VI secretion system-associated FHA domain protein TagH [Serratia ureilytica]
MQQQQTDPAALFNTDSTFEREHILADTTPSALLAEQAAPPRPAPRPECAATGTRAGSAGAVRRFIRARFARDVKQQRPAGAVDGRRRAAGSAGGTGTTAVPTTGADRRTTASAAPSTDAAAGAETRAAAPTRTAVQPAGTACATSAPAPGQPLGHRSGRLPVRPAAARRRAEWRHLGGPLLTALLQGIGLDDLQPQPHFDEQQIRQAGRLLSLFSQGTVALLSSRSILKRGVKAEMTMILDEANNPFKLLPSGKTVLMQMFGSQMPGFMPPEQAVRDALIDLQAHQLGMIAGIRAIIAAMLQSFNPERLEEEARKEGVAPRLSLPANRKAALWDYFVKNYQQTSGEIEDDFHTLFGEAFLHAYDVEVNQYKDSQTKPDA